MLETQEKWVGCEVEGCRYTDKRCHQVYPGFSMEQVYTLIIGERSYLKWQKKKLEFV